MKASELIGKLLAAMSVNGADPDVFVSGSDFADIKPVRDLGDLAVSAGHGEDSTLC